MKTQKAQKRAMSFLSSYSWGDSMWAFFKDLLLTAPYVQPILTCSHLPQTLHRQSSLSVLAHLSLGLTKWAASADLNPLEYIRYFHFQGAPGSEQVVPKEAVSLKLLHKRKWWSETELEKGKLGRVEVLSKVPGAHLKPALWITGNKRENLPLGCQSALSRGFQAVLWCFSCNCKESEIVLEPPVERAVEKD